MPIFRVVKNIVVEYEVRASEAEGAVSAAMDDYSWEREPGGKIRRRTSHGFKVEVDQLEADPPCRVLDGENPCDVAATRWAKGTEQWVCEKHAKDGVA